VFQRTKSLTSTLKRLLSSFSLAIHSFAFQNLVAFYFAQVRVKAKRNCGPKIIGAECFVPFSYAGKITSQHKWKETHLGMIVIFKFCLGKQPLAAFTVCHIGKNYISLP